MIVSTCVQMLDTIGLSVGFNEAIRCIFGIKTLKLLKIFFSVMIFYSSTLLHLSSYSSCFCCLMIQYNNNDKYNIYIIIIIIIIIYLFQTTNMYYKYNTPGS